MVNRFDTERLFSTLPKMTVTDRRIQNAYGKTTALFYEGEPYNHRETSVFCYMGVPNAPKPKGGYPAIVLVHGGGGCAFFEWVEFWNSKGYIAVAPDFSGRQFGSHELDGAAGEGIIESNPNGRPVDYGSYSGTKADFRDSWVYHSVCSIILAHNILLGNADVAPKKTAVTGISWGAVLVCIASGVDTRFSAFAPVYGGGYLRNSHCIPLENKTPEELSEWMEYYDPSSYLKDCVKPISFTVGADDAAFSLLSNTRSSELCRSKVYYSTRVTLPHYHRWKDEEGMKFVEMFINHILLDTPMPISIVSTEIADGKFICRIDNARNVKKAKFCYSFGGSDDSRQWKWTSVDTVFDASGTAICDIPQDVFGFFIEITDKSVPEIVISTKAYFNL